MGLIEDAHQDARRYGKRLILIRSILAWFDSGSGTKMVVMCGSKESCMEMFNHFLEFIDPWRSFFKVEVEEKSMKVTHGKKTATWEAM